MSHNKIFWIFSGKLESSLDRATWLETSQYLFEEGWFVDILSMDTNRQWISTQKVNITSVPKLNIYFLGNMLFQINCGLRILINLKKCDIVLFNQESVPIIALIYAFVKRKNIRPYFILDTRTLPMNETTVKEKLRSWFMRWSGKISMATFDGQTAITDRMVSELNIPQNKLIAIWPSGVNIDDFSFTCLNRRSLTKNSTLRLIYIGVIVKERNLLELCEAIEQLVVEGYPLQLTIVGEGSLRFDLEQKYINSKSIIVIPPVPSQAIPYVLSNVDIGVLPFPDEPRFRVSSPIKLFEYLASGMPVIATRIACHTDILSDDNTFWADDASVEGLKNAIVHAYERRGIFTEIAESSISIAKKYTWQLSAKKLSQGLKSIID